MAPLLFIGFLFCELALGAIPALVYTVSVKIPAGRKHADIRN